MKIAFFSNFMNHHQLPLCRELLRLTDGQFTFVAFEPIDPERLAMGYADQNALPFVVRAYESEAALAKTNALAESCDALILGSAPHHYALQRAKNNQLTFLFSERIHKQHWQEAFLPREFYRTYHALAHYRGKPYYLLSASAYAPFDYALHGAFLHKCFRWGYFPAAEPCDIDALMRGKSAASGAGLQLLWAGRFLDWKHPAAALRAADALQKAGIDFTLTLIGNGEQLPALQGEIAARGLQDRVRLPGFMPPEQVRAAMRRADIFLFTSDWQEGWGAVLNEAMNSGCAVVASHAVGATPYLVQDGKNGVIYTSGDQTALNAAVLALAQNAARREALGRAACRTITELWNAETAARRLVALCRTLPSTPAYPDGPCSAAPLLLPRKTYRPKENRL